MLRLYGEIPQGMGSGLGKVNKFRWDFGNTDTGAAHLSAVADSSLDFA